MKTKNLVMAFVIAVMTSVAYGDNSSNQSSSVTYSLPAPLSEANKSDLNAAIKAVNDSTAGTPAAEKAMKHLLDLASAIAKVNASSAAAIAGAVAAAVPSAAAAIAGAVATAVPDAAAAIAGAVATSVPSSAAAIAGAVATSVPSSAAAIAGAVASISASTNAIATTIVDAVMTAVSNSDNPAVANNLTQISQNVQAAVDQGKITKEQADAAQNAVKDQGGTVVVPSVSTSSNGI